MVYAVTSCMGALPSELTAISLARLRHDLKNPLACVKGYAEMILKGMAGPVSPNMERYVHRMLDAVTRQTLIIDSRLGGPAGASALPQIEVD